MYIIQILSLELYNMKNKVNTYDIYLQSIAIALLLSVPVMRLLS